MVQGLYIAAPMVCMSRGSARCAPGVISTWVWLVRLVEQNIAQYVVDDLCGDLDDQDLSDDDDAFITAR